METLLFLHHYWAYLVFLTLLIAVANAWYKKARNKLFTSIDFRISLFALIATHIQLVLGILCYLASPSLSLLKENGAQFMGNEYLRLRFLEHPTISILAVVFVTMGWSKHKKQPLSSAKFNKIALFYTIGLLLILSRVPLFWN